MVEPDVERAVSPFGEPGERAGRSRADGAIAIVDRPDDVAGEERLPARVSSDAVRPLSVCEPARGAEGHHEDHWPNLVLGHQLVLDYARLDGQKQRVGKTGRSVEK